MTLAPLVPEMEALLRDLLHPGFLEVAARRASMLDHLLDWRRRLAAEPEGALRDRALWALLGAERSLRSLPEADLLEVAETLRARLDTAIRVLRELRPRLETPPLP